VLATLVITSSYMNYAKHQTDFIRVAFGIALGFAANLIVNTATDTTSMRLQLGAPMVPAFILMVSIKWCPESPRWHMEKGDPENYRKAYNIFIALRNEPVCHMKSYILLQYHS
jgi:hypothetical protein